MKIKCWTTYPVVVNRHHLDTIRFQSDYIYIEYANPSVCEHSDPHEPRRYSVWRHQGFVSRDFRHTCHRVTHAHQFCNCRKQHVILIVDRWITRWTESADRLMGQWLVNWLINRLFSRFIEWLIYCWLIGWLIDHFYLLICAFMS